MRLVLFEPDIPQNVGTLLRLAACMDTAVDVVGPCGFVWSDRHLRRAGMDYLRHVRLLRHADWSSWSAETLGRRVLLTTAGDLPYTAFRFAPTDNLIVGRESAGVPPSVHDAADARLRIPMAPGMRSLNVSLATAMVLGEALRQTDALPERPNPAGTDPA